MTSDRLRQRLANAAFYEGIVLIAASPVVLLYIAGRSDALGTGILAAGLMAVLAIPPLLWGWTLRR